MGNRDVYSVENTWITGCTTPAFTTIVPVWARPSKPQYVSCRARSSLGPTGQPECQLPPKSSAVTVATDDVNGGGTVVEVLGTVVGTTIVPCDFARFRPWVETAEVHPARSKPTTSAALATTLPGGLLDPSHRRSSRRRTVMPVKARRAAPVLDA